MAPGTLLLMALLATAVRGHLRYPLDNITRRFATTAKSVATWSPCSGTNAWELSNLVEGDIMPSFRHTRIVTANEALKWENNTVPFTIDRDDFDDAEVKEILKVVEELNSLSCVKLVESSEEAGDLVRVTGEAAGCWAQVGRVGGPQVLNLQKPACLAKGTVVHEFFHTFGLHHMHNSPVRDQYIHILWPNVLDDKFFHKHTPEEAMDLGQRYDYGSIMHASRRANSKNDWDTIDPVDPTVTIGQRVKPSDMDITLLRKFYNCKR